MRTGSEEEDAKRSLTEDEDEVEDEGEGSVQSSSDLKCRGLPGRDASPNLAT